MKFSIEIFLETNINHYHQIAEHIKKFATQIQEEYIEQYTHFPANTFVGISLELKMDKYKFQELHQYIYNTFCLDLTEFTFIDYEYLHLEIFNEGNRNSNFPCHEGIAYHIGHNRWEVYHKGGKPLIKEVLSITINEDEKQIHNHHQNFIFSINIPDGEEPLKFIREAFKDWAYTFSVNETQNGFMYYSPNTTIKINNLI